MIILSLHTGYHDGTASLFSDYDLLAAVQLERLTRKKGDGGGIPGPAMDEVLAIAGLARRDVDAVVLSRASYPARYFQAGALKRAEYALHKLVGHEKLRDMCTQMQRTGEGDAGRIFREDLFKREYGFRPDVKIAYSNHHLAHALSALFYTDWHDALLYTADGCGDNVHYSHRILKDGHLHCLFGGEEQTLKPRRVDSLGLAYGFTTQALGYRMNRHEGKLTGLAAFGQPSKAASLGGHFVVDGAGVISSDFSSDTAMRDEIFKLAEGTEPADMAASIQQVLEDKILASVRAILKNHHVRRIGLAGGVFANVRLNRLLCEETDTDETFIFPGMGDEGITVGGALQFLMDRDGMAAWLKQRRRLSTVYLGRDHNRSIDGVLGGAGVTMLVGNPVDTAVGLIQFGKAGAIYEGRMEFGPRALGARSILASPADAGINASLNERLQRTEFMPFAPYVLEEDAADVFEVTSANRYAASFMTITTAVKPEWRERIPAVVHVDGTARPQVVRRHENPLYADILAAFKKATGLPVLVNTSFNSHEEPIINTPEECRRALVDDRVDFVVTGKGVYVRG
ncbi:MAG: carbamoyltransferase C-terminal domain-containing protein [Rhodospirillaceae bacterium]